jgi:hypothetical protein
MSWEAVSAIAETVGTVAVLLSILYLAKQIRISNRLARAEAWRSPNSDLSALNATFVADIDFRKNLQRVRTGAVRSDFAPDAQVHLDFYFISVANLYEQIFREIREGILDDRAIHDFGAKALFGTPYFRTSWQNLSGNLGKSFVPFFEAEFELAKE